MTTLRPVDAPTLQPLQQSFEYDQLESELKQVFLNVFESMIRPRERQLNLYGMQHLGDSDLIERALKDSGLAIVRRDLTRSSFLLKAARSRNPRRGMIFLRQYLQATWPNAWKAEALWHPVSTADAYPQYLTTLGTKDLGSDVTAEYLGNGITAQYSHDSENGLPTIYRTDWQGKQLLYTTPRTNILRHSADLSAAPWEQNLGGFWTSAASTDIPAPDSQVTGVTKFVATGKPYHMFARQFGVNSTAGARIASLWVYVPSQQGVYAWGLNAVWGGKESGSGSISTSFDKWIRISTKAVLAADRASVDFNIYPNGQNPLTGFHFFASYAQDEAGSVPTSAIATGDAPVTVTDYTIDATGVASFDTGPLPTPILHFRTGRIQVTLPAGTDNGIGLEGIGKAFRSILAARLMLELRLSTTLTDIGDEGGLALANGMAGSMPLWVKGTLLPANTDQTSYAGVGNGAVGIMPMRLTGTLN